jgi:hypothetical protein
MCSECLANLQRHALTFRAPTPRSTTPAPTAEALERHARRFGPALVTETAAEFGLEVEVPGAPQKKRVRGPSLKERVRRLVDAGHSADVIAEIEDLSPARARRLVEEVGK